MRAKEIIEYLNQHIISQDEAKKQLAILIKNKARYDKIEEEDWKRNITPFNALIIGPTGSGKTELFRKLADYLDVAFCKVDISGYTRSGYVGKDVEDIIRVHLLEAAKKKVIEKMGSEIKESIKENVIHELANAYVAEYMSNDINYSVLGAAFMLGSREEVSKERENVERVVQLIKNGDPEIMEKEVTIVREYIETPPGMVYIPESMKNQFITRRAIRDKISNLLKELIEHDVQEEVKHNPKFQRYVREAMQNGIVFIDEIDKIAGKNNDRIDTAGVQKELLTLVEGTTVMTEVGPVSTDHILFIAAGAFHTSKPSDLLPELLGRFPVRIVLKKLTKEDFKKILTEPKYSIIKKVQKLFEQDGIKIEFTDDAIDTIAEYAVRFNTEDEDIGARRLHTLVHMITEDIDLEIEDGKIGKEVVIDKEYVENKINEKRKYIEESLSYIDEEGGKRIGFVI